MKTILTILLMAIAIFLTLYLFQGSDKLDSSVTIDKILVEKSKRELHVFSNGELIKTYHISLGFSPLGHKEQEGDGKTPEGIYHIDGKNPNSAFHKNLGISYPNSQDRKHADSLGVSPGGLIKIHGIKNGFGVFASIIQMRDWTAGCIAVTNDEIEELYTAVPMGTPIEIIP